MAGSSLSQGNSRVAIYARVSTFNQDVMLQTRELQQFAETRGWTVVADYTDTGVSGAKDSRPELNRLMLAAKRRQFDVVLCWKLDRFGRSLRHLVNALAELEAVGVAFVSLTDNLDLTTPAGRLMFQVIAAMGEFERELIRERVRAGLRNARAKGKQLGRPKTIVDATRVAFLRAQGLGWKRIAAEMGVGVGTLYRLAPRGF
jgi:DNA invertase Pin-like site-specific DNA recombinase